MAGSYRHCVDEQGMLREPVNLIRDMLTTGADVYEAIEEMFGMIWWLAEGNAERVVGAAEHYRDGLALSPGLRRET